MKPDVAIDEIREVRHQMSAECGHDLDRFFTMLKEEEKQFEPQIGRWREMQRSLQQAAAPHESEAEGALLMHDKPKS